MRRRTILYLALASVFVSAIPTMAPDDPSLTVVINEICWAGASWDATAEWIELFNTTDRPIDMSGWIVASSDGAPTIRLHGILPPHTAEDPNSGYYLLERGSDTAVPEIEADLIYTGALTNRGETLTLLDALGRVVDTANLPPSLDTAGAWPAGADHRGRPPFTSMERIQYQLVDSPSNWGTYTPSDIALLPGAVLGTPRTENASYNVPPIPRISTSHIIARPGIPMEYSAAQSIDENDAIMSFHWDFGDGGTAEGEIVSHAYLLPGTYTITLVLTDSKGAQTSIAHDVTVTWTSPPLADFSVFPANGADIARAGDRLLFQDESSDDDSELIDWEWDFGDGRLGYGERVEHTYATDGDYIIGLHVIDAHGEMTMQTRSLRIASQRPIPAFTVTPEAPNEGTLVKLDASDSIDPDGTIVRYLWDLDGDGTDDQESTSAILEHVFDGGGFITLRLTVEDNQGERAQLERWIEVNFAPVAQFLLSTFSPKELQLLSLSDLSRDPDGEIVKWSWHFGDATFSPEPSPRHVYQDSGTMEITLTVTDDKGATDQAAAAITVEDLPPRAVLRPLQGPVLPTGTSFRFDATPSFDLSPNGEIMRYEWSLAEGDGYGVETSVPILSHAYPEDGTYMVRVRVTDNDGSTHESEGIRVTVTNRPPQVTRVTWSPASPVDGEEVVLTAQATDPDGDVRSWVWRLPDGSTASSQEVAFTFEDNGDHEISVLVRDDDNVSSDERRLTIPVQNAPPVAAFSAVQDSACGVASVRFDASGSYDPSPLGRIVHYAWDFGDNTHCPGTSSGCSETTPIAPEHCYSEPGTYIVTLVVIDEHGAVSQTQQTILIGE